MENTPYSNSISERFSQDIRLFELYQKEIRKTINKLETKIIELQRHVDGGGSIAILPKAIPKPYGGFATRVGLDDTPEIRELLSFAMSRRIDELKEYVDISLRMAFSYLISIFDARFDDIIVVYFNSIRNIFPDDKVRESKSNALSRLGFTEQMKFFKKNIGLDFGAILGKEMIKQIIERRECRNLVVHNSGFVDKYYRRNVPGTNLSVGDKYPLDYTYLESSIELFSLFFMHYYSELERKMGAFIDVPLPRSMT
ncbi:hypothetical protein [Pedobacter sp. R-06]|uniref:hypothetical protein n=1 Tax=Pedobacter sp. R-06 TaxID=3404051 RepID=UPI003CEBD815